MWDSVRVRARERDGPGSAWDMLNKEGGVEWGCERGRRRKGKGKRQSRGDSGFLVLYIFLLYSNEGFLI